MGSTITQSSPTTQPMTVSVLTWKLKQHIQGAFRCVLVQGEVSNMRTQASGHVYFSLKDAHAQVSCALFRRQAEQLTVPLQEGDEVIVLGDIDLYPPRGSMQLIVRTAQRSGIGALLAQLERLRKELNELGWFEHKQTLPRFPKKIAIITSPTGAVVQDVIRVLKRRCAIFHLIVVPVAVQGASASQEIAEAVRLCNEQQLAEVLIVARGGGSIEDLWAFNERVVAEAIHQSEIPVISAVGHETDYLLSDDVADARAPTPSAAAEMVLPSSQELLEQLEGTSQQLNYIMQTLLRKCRNHLCSIEQHPWRISPLRFFSSFQRWIDEAQNSLDRSIQWALQTKKQHIHAQRERVVQHSPLALMRKRAHDLNQLSLRATQIIRSLLSHHGRHVRALRAHLNFLNPKAMTQKGYALLFSGRGKKVIASTKEVKKGDEVRIMLQDGTVVAHVNGIDKKIK